MLAVDTETTGIDIWHGCKPFFVSMCSDNGDIFSWEWDVDPFTREIVAPASDRQEIQQLLDKNQLVLHNTKFDVRALKSVGISLSMNTKKYDDTLLMSHVLDSAESHGLKNLAVKYLDIKDDDQKALRDATNKARIIARKKKWDTASSAHKHFPAQHRSPYAGWWVMDTWLPRQIAIEEGYPDDHPWHTVLRTYAIQDVERTILLYRIFADALKRRKLKDVYQKRKRLLSITYKVEQNRVTIHVKKIKSEIIRYQETSKKSLYKATRLLGPKFKDFNPHSYLQKQHVLYTYFGLPTIKKTKGGGAATDAETMEKLRNHSQGRAKKFIDFILHTLRCETSADFLQHVLDHSKNGQLQHNLNVTGTKTTRQSATMPNVMAVGKGKKAEGEDEKDHRLRVGFGPRPGRVWYAMDFVSAEVWCFAYETQDKELIEALNQGESLHMIIARELHGDITKDDERYDDVKRGDFALIYGASEWKADDTFKIRGAYKRIRKRFPGIDRFIQRMHTDAKRKGYIETRGGYPIRVPTTEPHKAASYRIQGTVGYIMMDAMIACESYLIKLRKRHIEARMIMQVHDELVFDFPATKSIKNLNDEHNTNNLEYVGMLKTLMERAAASVGVPIPVEVDLVEKDWANGKTISFKRKKKRTVKRKRRKAR